MPALPGWDSLESVSRWHSFFEIFGLVCAGLVVVASVLAYQYGQRKDELVAAAEALRSGQAVREREETEARRQSEVAELQRQLSEAGKMVTELQQRQAPRHLSDDQRAKLADYLGKNPKSSVVVKASSTAPDARQYANEIVEVFRQAGWDVQVDDAIFIGADTSGVWLKVRPPIPDAAQLIHAGFKFAGIPIRDKATPNPTGPEGEVWLQVGHK